MKTVRLLVAVLALAGCAAAPPARGPFDAAAIDAEARRLMARESVQGLALAVIEDGEVVHVAAYGRRNVERDLPLTTDTIMYGASLTKTAFAYMVMQLVDEGRLDLDASVADLLPRPLPEYEDYADLAGDERWRALTPRILLTHTIGVRQLPLARGGPAAALPLRSRHALRLFRRGILHPAAHSRAGARAGRRPGDADARLRPLRHDPHEHVVAAGFRGESRRRLWTRRHDGAARRAQQRQRRRLDGHQHRRPGASVGRHHARATGSARRRARR